MHSRRSWLLRLSECRSWANGVPQVLWLWVGFLKGGEGERWCFCVLLFAEVSVLGFLSTQLTADYLLFTNLSQRIYGNIAAVMCTRGQKLPHIIFHFQVFNDVLLCLSLLLVKSSSNPSGKVRKENRKEKPTTKSSANSYFFDHSRKWVISPKLLKINLLHYCYKPIQCFRYKFTVSETLTVG